MKRLPTRSVAARRSPDASNRSKRLGGGRATNDASSASAKREAGVRRESMRAVRIPAVLTVIVTGPVSVWPSRGAPARSSVSGKTKLRQARCVQDAAGQVHADPSAGASAGTESVTPDCSNRIVISFTTGSAANTGSSRCNVTTSPGPANGVVTDPRVDGNVRSLAGIRLHAPRAGDEGTTESANATRETETYADLFIVTPITRAEKIEGERRNIPPRSTPAQSKRALRQQKCPVMRSCKRRDAEPHGLHDADDDRSRVVATSRRGSPVAVADRYFAVIHCPRGAHRIVDRDRCEQRGDGGRHVEGAPHGQRDRGADGRGDDPRCGERRASRCDPQPGPVASNQGRCVPDIRRCRSDGNEPRETPTPRTAGLQTLRRHTLDDDRLVSRRPIALSAPRVRP